MATCPNCKSVIPIGIAKCDVCKADLVAPQSLPQNAPRPQPQYATGQGANPNPTRYYALDIEAPSLYGLVSIAFSAIVFCEVIAFLLMMVGIVKWLSDGCLLFASMFVLSMLAVFLGYMDTKQKEYPFKNIAFLCGMVSIGLSIASCVALLIRFWD